MFTASPDNFVEVSGTNDSARRRASRLFPEISSSKGYIEYEGLSNPRGAVHSQRILANDPGALGDYEDNSVILPTSDYGVRLEQRLILTTLRK